MFLQRGKRQNVFVPYLGKKPLNLEMDYHTEHQVLINKQVFDSKMHVERANKQKLLKG